MIMEIVMKRRTPVLTFILTCAVAAAPLSLPNPSSAAATAAREGQSEQPSGGQGVEALRQGRRLLKQGKADQALPLLETALKSFTVANAVRGQAATHDALGDLYSRQGQHRTALSHYQKAREGFQAAGNSAQSVIAKRVVGVGDEEFNANLMLAKIGEAHYRAGNIAESGSAYSQMQVTKPDTNALSVAKKGKGLFGGLSGIGRGIARGGVWLSTGTSVAGVIS